MVTTIVAGRFPVSWRHRKDPWTIERIAAPMAGGLINSTVFTIIGSPRSPTCTTDG
jgi:Cu/Ag efflux pump CusA